jgi:SAM-dependent methyltransferase
VDLVTAGQAFHWFDPGPTRREFARILKPGGYVAFIWNTRRKEGKPFLAGYEELLRNHGTDYPEVYHGRRGSRKSISGFFHPDPVEEATFRNRQTFDFEALRGRLLSSSTCRTRESRDTWTRWRLRGASSKSTRPMDPSSWSTTPRSSSARSPTRRPFARGARYTPVRRGSPLVLPG